MVTSAESSANSQEVISIGGLPNMDTPPYFWFDQCSGKVVGVLPHLAKKILSDAGYQVEFQPPVPVNKASWDKSIDRLLNGGYDLSMSLYKPPPEGVVIGEESLVFQRQSRLMRKNEGVDSVGLSTLKARKGVILDAGKNGSNYRLLEEFMRQGYEVSANDNIEESLKELLEKKLDFILGDHYYLVGYLRVEHATESVDLIPVSKGKGIYFGAAESGAFNKLPHQLDEIIIKYRNTGLVDELFKIYLLRWLRSECK